MIDICLAKTGMNQSDPRRATVENFNDYYITRPSGGQSYPTPLFSVLFVSFLFIFFLFPSFFFVAVASLFQPLIDSIICLKSRAALQAPNILNLLSFMPKKGRPLNKLSELNALRVCVSVCILYSRPLFQNFHRSSWNSDSTRNN